MGESWWKLPGPSLEAHLDSVCERAHSQLHALPFAGYVVCPVPQFPSYAETGERFSLLCGFLSHAFKAEQKLAQVRAACPFLEDHTTAPVFPPCDGLVKASCILLTTAWGPRWSERMAAAGEGSQAGCWGGGGEQAGSGVRWGLSPAGPTLGSDPRGSALGGRRQGALCPCPPLCPSFSCRRGRCVGPQSWPRAQDAVSGRRQPGECRPRGGKEPWGGAQGWRGCCSGPTCTHLSQSARIKPRLARRALRTMAGVKGTSDPTVLGRGGLGAPSWGHLQVYHPGGTGRQVFPSSVKAPDGQGTKQKKFF